MKVRKILIYLSVLTTSLMTSAIALAEEVAKAGGGDDEGTLISKYMAAAFAIGVAAAGGAVGQGRCAGSAVEGIARNPNAVSKITTPMILGLALIESLVIYALLVSLLILIVL